MTTNLSVPRTTGFHPIRAISSALKNEKARFIAPLWLLNSGMFGLLMQSGYNGAQMKEILFFSVALAIGGLHVTVGSLGR